MSSNNDFQAQMERKVRKIEEILQEYLPRQRGYQSIIMEAMSYSLLAGGKRLRPMLMMDICFVLGFIVSFSCICCRWLESCSTTPFFWLSHTRQGLRWFSLPDLPAGCFGQSR